MHGLFAQTTRLYQMAGYNQEVGKGNNSNMSSKSLFIYLQNKYTEQ